MLEDLLIARATHGGGDNQAYFYLRTVFMNDPALKELLPDFVRTCRSLDAFRSHSQGLYHTYGERRLQIRQALGPLMEHIEGRHSPPGDGAVAEAITSFDADGIYDAWAKAVERRTSDPEGAITAARSLLETVCKHILDARDEPYDDGDDLPKLYRRTASALNLAPEQHAEGPIRSILGGATTMVNGLGTLRNRMSDAHGQGARLAVKPAVRHATLAVNTAGAVATFLIETHLERGRS